MEHLSWKPIKVGILDFGDGRSFLQKPLAPVNEEFCSRLVKALEENGFEVVQGDEVMEGPPTLWRPQHFPDGEQP